MEATKAARIGAGPSDAGGSKHFPQWKTEGGTVVVVRLAAPLASETATTERATLQLHLNHARLRMLRGYDQLLCLDGLRDVEHLPHQIETVRKVLRHFRGRVLLADEVGLGKTIEACLLLREYLLRGLARRVLIITPAPLVSQWDEELRRKFGLAFAIPPRSDAADAAEYWTGTERVLCSMSFAKSPKRCQHVAAASWDLVIVDEAHHCKNRATQNWKLVNALTRKHMFLLTATPVQNNLVELYNLLTLLEPGHLRTEADFKKHYVQRGNPRDPRNREKLRALLAEVMVRNTRSLVQLNLPQRYAQTIAAAPAAAEAELYRRLEEYLRARAAAAVESEPADGGPAAGPASGQLSRMQVAALLTARGSHPAAVAESLRRRADREPDAQELADRAAAIERSAKDDRLLDLIRQATGHKVIVFVNLLATMHRLQALLESAGIGFSTFSGEQSDAQKDAAVEALRHTVDVMLCTDAGGEGRNLQFADTLINYDLPWNPMRIEQRIGRVHRIGQTREVFVFNLCTTGSLEERLLRVLNDKIRMFELVVGEVSSILGNLEGGEEFESLVLSLWLRAGDDQALARSFDALGNSLLEAHEEYVQAKELDEALFGEEFE